MNTSIREKNVRLKRAYEKPSAEDGVRVLVDRLWPRGVRKADAAIDYWFKELSPSTELRNTSLPSCSYSQPSCFRRLMTRADTPRS